jgi:hypothetical protein
LSREFRGDGFVLSWTAGNINSTTNDGPFLDPSEDLLHLDMRKTEDGTNYMARVTRIVGGFDNPVDSVFLGSVLYVLEYSGDEAVWQVLLPTETQSPGEMTVTPSVDSGTWEIDIADAPGDEVTLLVSDNLVDWFALEIKEAIDGAASFTIQPGENATYYDAVTR